MECIYNCVQQRYMIMWYYCSFALVRLLTITSIVLQGETKGLEPGHYLGNVKDLDPINGRFTAKEGGVFLITASIQLSTSTASSVPTTKTPEPEAGTERRRRESASQLQEVSVAVCIDASSDNCNE